MAFITSANVCFDDKVAEARIVVARISECYETARSLQSSQIVVSRYSVKITISGTETFIQKQAVSGLESNMPKVTKIQKAKRKVGKIVSSRVRRDKW
jgi:hypothetical protein